MHIMTILLIANAVIWFGVAVALALAPRYDAPQSAKERRRRDR